MAKKIYARAHLDFGGKHKYGPGDEVKFDFKPVKREGAGRAPLLFDRQDLIDKGIIEERGGRN